MSKRLVCVVFLGIGLGMAYSQSPESALTPATRSVESLENRFRHSLLLLRDIYEKVLALDHHFTSLKTHNDVFQIANPQSYPEFGQVMDEIRSQTKRKYHVDMPDFLGQNAIFSGAFTLLSIFLSDKSAQDKSEALDQVSCLLDFTMRMQTDLNIIFYEMEFLRESNERLMESCLMLFDESCALIGYDKSLNDCREHDDWEVVFENASLKFRSLRTQAVDATFEALTIRETNNFNFRIDRTAHFIQEYAAVISQGLQHYRKFEKIVTRYETEDHCVAQLPESFSQLKSDVRITLDKFNHAYKLPELYGSKLKALLYGSVEP